MVDSLSNEFYSADEAPLSEPVDEQKVDEQAVDDGVVDDGAIEPEGGEPLDGDSVPDYPEGYKFDRSDLPEGTDYDDELESVFREFAHNNDITQSRAAELYRNYNDMMMSRAQAAQDDLNDAAERLQRDLPDADKKLGVDGSITQGLLNLSAELEMDYYDEDGNKQSYLIDDLELIRKNGSYGDKVALIKAFDHLLSLKYPQGQEVEGAMFSKNWYANPEKRQTHDLQKNYKPLGGVKGVR